MQGKHRHECQVGGVGETANASAPRHLSHLQRTRQAADITDIGLDHVDCVDVDHALPLAQHAVLLAACDADVKRLADLASPVELPVGTGLLEMTDAVALQHAAHLDRLLRRVTAVGIDHENGAISKRLTHGRDDRLRAARPLVLIMPALLADPKLEGGEAEIVPKARQPVRFLAWADVAPHARCIGGIWAWGAAKQLTDTLAGALPAQVPQRGVQPGQRAIKVRAGKLVLTLRDQRHQAFDSVGLLAQGVRCDLAMKDKRGDVRLIWRHLAPPAPPLIGGNAYQADKPIAEGFDRGDTL